MRLGAEKWDFWKRRGRKKTMETAKYQEPFRVSPSSLSLKVISAWPVTIITLSFGLAIITKEKTLPSIGSHLEWVLPANDTSLLRLGLFLPDLFNDGPFFIALSSSLGIGDDIPNIAHV